MQNLLRPFRGAPVHFCGVLRTPSVFPKHGCSKMVAQMYDEKTRAVTDRRYSTTGERSRARKSAENKIQAGRLGQCERLRRAVDCAPYQRSAYRRCTSATVKPRCKATRASGAIRLSVLARRADCKSGQSVWAVNDGLPSQSGLWNDFCGTALQRVPQWFLPSSGTRHSRLGSLPYEKRANYLG